MEMNLFFILLLDLADIILKSHFNEEHVLLLTHVFSPELHLHLTHREPKVRKCNCKRGSGGGVKRTPSQRCGANKK